MESSALSSHQPSESPSAPEADNHCEDGKDNRTSPSPSSLSSPSPSSSSSSPSTPLTPSTPSSMLTTSTPSSPLTSPSADSDEDYDPLKENTSSHSTRKGQEKNNKRLRGMNFICRQSGCHFRAECFRSLCEHDRTHCDTLKPFMCRFCSRRNRTQSNMLSHIVNIHSTEVAACPGGGEGGRMALIRHVDIDQAMLDREQQQIEQWLVSEECRVKASANTQSLPPSIRPPPSSSSLATSVPTTATSNSDAAAPAPTTAAGAFSCRVCGRIDFGDFESLRRHDRWHSKFKPFQCTFPGCSFAVPSKEEVERHFIKYHDAKDVTFMCTWYMKTDEPGLAKEEEAIKQWLNTVDVQIASSSSTANGQRPSAAFQTSTIENVADGNIVESSNNTAASTNTASSPPPSNAESLGPLVICRTNPKDGPPIYICQRPNCKQKFSHYHRLVRHDRIHRKANPWRCGMCGYLSSQTYNIKTHLRSVHFNPIWGKKKSKNLAKHFDDYLLEYLEEDSELLQQEKELFANAIMLTLPSNSDEMEEKNPEQEAEEEEEDEGDEENQLSEVNELVIYRQIRNNQVSYICQRPLCGREFTKPIKLKFHDRSHSGVRPYRCRECGYTSTLKVNLSKHVHRLHDCDTENDDLIEEDAELLKVENELFEYAMKQLLGPSGENEEDEDEDEYLPPPPETAVSTSPSTLAAAAASSSPSTSATAVAAPSSEEDSLIICRRTRGNRSYFICQRGMPPCRKVCFDISSLKCHDRLHRGVAPFSCKVCHHSTAEQGNVKKHIIRRHPEVNPRKHIVVDENALQAERRLFARAERRDLPSPSQTADEEEMEEEEEEEEELSDDSSSGIEVVEEEEEEEEEPDEAVRAYYEKLLEEFECPLKCRIVPDCQWRFASADDLRDHEREHAGVKPFQCTWPAENFSGTAISTNSTDNICGQSFFQKKYTRKHIRAEHCSRAQGADDDDEDDDDLRIDQYIFVDLNLLNA